jgi:hypothetical protein
MPRSWQFYFLAFAILWVTALGILDVIWGYWLGAGIQVSFLILFIYWMVKEIKAWRKGERK